MGDTRRVDRMIEVLGKIDRGEQVTPKGLAGYFGVSERSIYRDLSCLTGNFPIHFDEQANSYRFLEGYSFKRIDMSLDEIRAVLATQAIVSKLGSKVSNAFGNVLKKIKVNSGPRASRGLACNAQSYWFDIDPVADFSSVQKQFDAVQRAMDERTSLDIRYKGMGDQTETARKIDPYGLFYSCGVWYALAHCHLRKDTRQFALDCIKGFKESNLPYDIPRDFSMDKYFKGGWHIIRYGKPVEVRLWFSGDVARWITRKKWHPSQKIEAKGDGSIIFKVTLNGTEEIRRWVYHWGPNCEVLAPANFRKEVAEELKIMAAVYRKKAGSATR